MKKFFLFLLLVPAMLVQAQTEITCAQAREYALSVGAEGELYNGGATYVVQGYVTFIQNAWSSQYKMFLSGWPICRMAERLSRHSDAWQKHKRMLPTRVR